METSGRHEEAGFIWAKTDLAKNGGRLFFRQRDLVANRPYPEYFIPKTPILFTAGTEVDTRSAPLRVA